MGKLQKYMGSGTFRINILKGALSSIPRWDYFRGTEKNPPKMRGAKKTNDSPGVEDSDDEFTYVSATTYLLSY